MSEQAQNPNPGTEPVIPPEGRPGGIYLDGRHRKRRGPITGQKYLKHYTDELPTIMATLRRRVRLLAGNLDRPVTRLAQESGETASFLSGALRRPDLMFGAILRIARIFRVEWRWLLGAGDEKKPMLLKEQPRPLLRNKRVS